MIDSWKEWEILKKCHRRLNDGQGYTLTAISRVIGMSVNISRDPIFTKMIAEGVLDGKEGRKRGFMPRDERRSYVFDRDRLTDCIVDFWCDEIKKATGKRLGVVHI